MALNQIDGEHFSAIAASSNYKGFPVIATDLLVFIYLFAILNNHVCRLLLPMRVGEGLLNYNRSC